MEINRFTGKIRALFLYAFVFMALSSLAYAAIGTTHPSDLELKPGESDRFKFEIQAVSHNSDVECSFNPDTNDLFSIVFDQQSPMNISEGGSAIVTGTVSVNQSTEPGVYRRNIEVSCKDISDQAEGGSAAIGVYNIFLNVNVVGDRTRENIYVSPLIKKRPFMGYISTPIGIGIAIAIIFIIILILLLIRRRNKKIK